ncbi:MAG: diguanylate cyclase, partial [Mesorhizobium sp.]|nr:diguanylate cyclase [Mesorhizobium sp.]
MQPAAVSQDRNSDLTTTVVATMRQLGVVGIPRNYEIFYEALNGSNPELSLAVVELSSRPTQDDLDRIGRQFFAQNHGQGIVDQARDVLAKELEDIASLLRNERTQVEKYGKILDETSGGLANRATISRDLLQKIVSAVSVATASTIDRGRQVASTLNDKTAELESVKSKLEEYKRLADTDPLTQVWNRRAFDKEIARIYNSNKGILFNALILVDIDRFKDINDKFGHPVGDKLLAQVAARLKSMMEQGMTCGRLGGDEFAVVLHNIVSPKEIEDLARRIIATISRPYVVDNHQLFVGASVGYAIGPQDGNTVETLTRNADLALYKSKDKGGNVVAAYVASLHA